MKNISRRNYLELMIKTGIGTYLGTSFLNFGKTSFIDSTQVFSRYIPDDAYQQITFHKKNAGIQYFNFTPKGGWILINNKKVVVGKNLPKGCHAKVESYVKKGHIIKSISFLKNNPRGYLIITNRTKFARYIPSKTNKELERLINKGHKIEFVAIPPTGSKESYLILTNKGYSIHKIDDECFQMIKNLRQKPTGVGNAPRKIHFVGFDYKGGWVIIANDYYFQKNIHSDCSRQLKKFQNKKRQTDFIAFSPTRQGFSMFSNTQFSNPPEDKIREFEASFANGTKTIWDRMREINMHGVSIGVVINNQIAWSCGYGILNQKRKDAVHPNSLWQAASISKVVAATSAMKLVEEGRMNLNDDIRNLLTNWNLNVNIPNANIVKPVRPTLENLLSHTAGINKSGFSGYKVGVQDLPNLIEILNGHSDPSRSTIPNHGRIEITNFPGTHRYSGGGYTVLEQIIKDVRLRSFSSITRANILQPLEMNDTFFSTRIPNKYTTKGNYNLTAGHGVDGNILKDFIEESDQLRGLNHLPEFAAAGMYTTALDLCKFIIMLNRGGTYINSNNREVRVLQKSTVDNLFTSRTGSRALGFLVRNNTPINSNNFYFQHGGSNAGIRNTMRGYPNKKTGVVVLTNNNNKDFRNEVRDAIINTFGW